MPQIQILDPVPSFGSELGKSLGTGISQGINQGISANLQNMLSRKKERGNVRRDINALTKRYAKDTFLPDQLHGFEKRALELLESGEARSSQEATLGAFEEFAQQKIQEDLGKKPEKSFLQKNFGIEKPEKGPLSGKYGLENLKEDLKGAASKFGYPFAALASLGPQALQGLGYAGRYGIYKAQGLDDKQIAAQESALAQATREGEEATGIINPIAPGGTSLLEGYERFTGGRGAGVTPTQRTIQGGLVGGIPGAAANVVNELGQELGLPAPAQAAIDALTFVGTLKAQPHIKLPSFKANKKVLSKAEEVAAKTGQTAEEVIQNAQQKSGASLEKALAGDATEINKLNRAITVEAPAISKKVEQVNKNFFDKKAAIKEREAFGAKLPESPFYEYFAAEAKEAKKLASKKSETVAKEAENAARIKPLEEKVSSRLQDEKNQLRELQKSKGGLQGNALDRVEASIVLKERQIEKTLEELKDLRYELKYGRKRPSEAEIDAAIKKSGEEIAKEAKNPTPAGQKKIADQLKLDKEYIDRAEKLAARGELPGEIRPDTFIKMKQKYLDGYNAMIQELRAEIKSLKGARDAESLQKIANNRKAIDVLQGRTKRLKADIINQTDKIKAMKAIEGPSGAFYRQQLKGLQKDVAQFQHDFFRNVGQPETVRQVETNYIARNKIAEIPKTKKSVDEAVKIGEEVGKNPTQENLKVAAELTGEKPEVLKKETENFGDIIKKNGEKIEAGKANEIDIQKTEKKIDGFLRFKMNLGSAGIHFFVGALTGIVENEMEIKIPRTYLYGAASIAYGGSDLIRGTQRSTGRSIGFGAGHFFVNYIYNTKEADKLKSLRQKGPNEYSEYVQSLKKRYSAKRVNEIIDQSK